MNVSRYDAFIAYRRPDGADLARQLEAALLDFGLYPFLDLTDLCRGHFELPVLKRVAEIPNFVVVLGPGALDRCHENGDWLGREIGQALQTSRNIIPLLMPGFCYPTNLPRALQDLPRRPGLECTFPFSGQTVTAIAEIVDKGRQKQNNAARRRMLVAGLASAALLLAGFVGMKLVPVGAALGFGSWRLPQKPAAIALSSRSGGLKATLAGARGTADGSLQPKQRITYHYVRESELAQVDYRLPYLDLVRQGGPVEGLICDPCPFSGEIPELVVDVNNGTEHAIGLSTIILKIDFSKIEAEAIPVIADLSPGSLRVTNQGWARIEMPTLRFSFISNYDHDSTSTPQVHTLSLPTIADSKSILSDPYIPDRLRGDQVVKVAGTMEFGEASDRRSITFSTVVINDQSVTTGVPTMVPYHAYFPAGQIEPVIVDLEPGPAIEPGATATLLIRVRTDKTATTRLSVNLTTTDGALIDGEPFLLKSFVQRLQRTRWRKEPVKRPTIRAELGR
jgi:hypothetical protein